MSRARPWRFLAPFFAPAATPRRVRWCAPRVEELENRVCPSGTLAETDLFGPNPLGAALDLDLFLGSAALPSAPAPGGTSSLGSSASGAGTAGSIPVAVTSAPGATAVSAVANLPGAGAGSKADTAVAPSLPAPAARAAVRTASLPGEQGSFSMWNPAHSLAGVTFDPGVVGVAIGVWWNRIQTGPTTFDWSQIDARIQEAQAKGLKVALTLITSPTQAPAFVAQDPQVQTISLVDTEPSHPTYGQPVTAPVFWDPVFLQAKEAFIAAAGQRYAGNPTVVAATATFAGWYTDDWIVPHWTGSFSGGGTSTTLAQSQQWIDAGYTTAKMLAAGEAVIDATAQAFPNQVVKMPIGVTAPALDGTATALASAVLDYAYGKYPTRFFAQVNALNIKSPTASALAANPPTANNFFYLYTLLERHSPQIGLQMLASATTGPNDGYRLNGGTPGAPDQVLQNVVDTGLTYNPTYLEFGDSDTPNPALADVIPTFATGGTATVPPPDVALAIGADAGGGPEVKLIDAVTGATRLDFYAYSPQFSGGARVAVGDLTGDGVADVVTAPGPGMAAEVRVWDGQTGQIVRDFLAYDSRFQGGVQVAVGDVTGDGVPDIITAPDAGGGPDVRVWDGQTGALVREWMAYDPRFTGGVRVAAGDVTGDGRADVITAPGGSGGPDVRVWDGASGGLAREWMAYAPTFLGGVYVAAGDTNGDGRADVITGQGAGGGPVVNVYSGSNGALLQSFLAYDAAFTGGVRVGAADVNGDGQAEVLAGAGPGGSPQVSTFGPSATALDSFYAYTPAFAGGVYVGGS